MAAGAAGGQLVSALFTHGENHLPLDFSVQIADPAGSSSSAAVCRLSQTVKLHPPGPGQSPASTLLATGNMEEIFFLGCSHYFLPLCTHLFLLFAFFFTPLCLIHLPHSCAFHLLFALLIPGGF